jgi:Domain of unknown function (DUF1918)
MQATVGDRLHVRGNAVGQPDKIGLIVEVHGVAGAPPYLVRFEDGHTRLCFPGPDAVVERPAKAAKKAPATGRRASSGGRKAGAGSARKK